jgi:Asp-tRNA(Asn)/Glu-tRNA(Gln) amidotransferase A subunit family amidase
MEPVKSVISFADAVRAGRSTAVSAVEDCRRRYERLNPAVNAFAFVDWSQAVARAREIDKSVADGADPGSLAGVPFAVKDIENCAGMPTTYGFSGYRNRPAVGTDDPNIARLKSAGAIPVGKTTTPEFAFDSITSTPAFGVTRNPWDRSKTPGGSSGGSAAAVSAGIVPFATGTDEGGSIRSPAAFCGLVGLKPTHGLVARVDSVSDTNTMSVLACSATETARLLDVMAGRDDRDKMSQVAPSSLERQLETPVRSGLRAVWSADFGYVPVDREVVELAEDAARCLAEAAEMSLMAGGYTFTNANDAWMPIVSHRIRSQLEHLGIWPDRLSELSETPRQWLEQFGSPTPKEYGAALALRAKVESEMSGVFAENDLLMTPTVACPAFDAEGPIPEVIDGRDARATGAEAFTMVANLAWLPAISIPAGLTKTGLPVGLQVIGRRWSDGVLLQLANVFASVRPWPRHAPLEHVENG